MTKPRKNLPEAVALRYDRDAAEGADQEHTALVGT